MSWEPINKPPAAGCFNLADYQHACEEFSWSRARQWLDGLPGGGLNIAYEAVDRHACGLRPDAVALRCLGRRGEVTDYSYRSLREETNRFANLLRGLGVGNGDRVFSLLGRVPELYIALGPALADASAEFAIPPSDPEDLALLHFTGGTTGKPKGTMHVHQAVVAHHASARFALDLRAGDVFWCTADPGWETGTSYGIIAPLTHGATLVTDAGDFDAGRWCQVLSGQRVTVWYTAPTALRMMMRHGSGLARQHDLSALRLVASAGEPLNPEVVVWGVEALACRSMATCTNRSGTPRRSRAAGT